MVKFSAMTLLPLAASASLTRDATKVMNTPTKPLTLPMSAAFESTQATAATGAPNILVFMVDDLGYGDVSFMAKTNEDMEAMDVAKATPTLNSLASSGVVLGSFYVSPTCTPSRASFLTGRYPTNIGLQDSVIHATEPRGVGLDFEFLPSKLNAAGYNTMGVGKWHVGFHQPQYLPTRRGFQEYFGILTGGGGHFTHTSTGSFTLRGDFKKTTVDMVGYNLWHNGLNVNDEDKFVSGRHSTDIYTDVAIAQLKAATESNSEAPFFLYLSFQAIHAPIEVEDKYIDGTISNGCDAISVDDTLGNKRKLLCGMVSQLDDSAAALVAHLTSTDQWENTVFAFVSDNGGIESHGSSNMPFKGGKGTYYEGGIRVPAFLSGGFVEKSLAAASTSPYRSNSLVHISDLHTTFLSLAQVSYSTASSIATDADTLSILDGVNQWDFLMAGGELAADSNAAFIPRKDILHNMNTETFGGGGALRVGDYKLFVEAKVSDSEVYTYAQHILQDGAFSASDVSMIVDTKLLKGGATFKIFNVAKNPTEREDGTCDDVESCDSIYNVQAFKHVEIAMMDAWKSYMQKASPSSLEWLDDGPLADPSLFGGYWVPWRDEEGLPYAAYSTVDKTDRLINGNAGNTDKGEGDGNGDKTWKLTSDQKQEIKMSHKGDSREMLVAAESTSSGSGTAHPYLLLGSGAVLGAVFAVAVLTKLQSKQLGVTKKMSPV